MDPVEQLFEKHPQTYPEALDLVLNAVRSIVLARHEEYGHKNLTKRGHLGLIVRTEDKLARIEQKSGRKDSLDTITKAWGDTIGYAAQGILYELGWIALPTSESPTGATLMTNGSGTISFPESVREKNKELAKELIEEIQPDTDWPWTPFIQVGTHFVPRTPGSGTYPVNGLSPLILTEVLYDET
jgi:hypothetical protein